MRFPAFSGGLETRSADNGPSFGGLAFAGCAAALPLFRLPDAVLIATLSAFFANCLPLIVEPLPQCLGTCSDAAVSAHMMSHLRLTQKRLQHVLTRLDSVCSTYFFLLSALFVT